MRHIMWTPDPLETSANRAERAVVNGYELVVLDLPSKAHFAALITWELFGPPDRKATISWGEANTFEDAKTQAEKAFAEIKNPQT